MRRCKLGEIAEFKTGPFGTQFKANEYTQTGVPVINVKNIGNGLIIEDELEYISDTTKQRLSSHIIHHGDIVFARKGSVERHAYIDKKYDGWVQGSDCIKATISSEYNSEYISYYLYLESVKQQLLTHAVGSTMPSMNTDILSDIDICYPTDATKVDKVVSLLRNIKNKIALNNRLNATLEAMAKTLYDYWCVQFDFPDEKGRPYKTSGGKMVYNGELGREIPAGWEVVPLSQVALLQYGYPLSTDMFCNEGIPVIRIRDIMDNSTSAITNESVQTQYLTKKGDLLVGMDGNFQMNYWTRDGEIVNQRITRIRKKEIPIMIIRFQIEPFITAKITNVARSTVGHLGDTDFKERLIIVPSKLDMSVFDAMINKIISYRNESRRLATLRDWLLPMLMNGQVGFKGE